MAWSTVCFLIFLILLFSIAVLKLFPYYSIHISARRIGLRDKGYTGNEDDSSITVHDFCETRLRIGIDKQGTASEYCWKCEYIFPDDPDPKEKEPAPVAYHDYTNIRFLKKTGTNG